MNKVGTAGKSGQFTLWQANGYQVLECPKEIGKADIWPVKQLIGWPNVQPIIWDLTKTTWVKVNFATLLMEGCSSGRFYLVAVQDVVYNHLEQRGFGSLAREELPNYASNKEAIAAFRKIDPETQDQQLDHSVILRANREGVDIETAVHQKKQELSCNIFIIN